MTEPGDVWLVVGFASGLLAILSLIGSMIMREIPLKFILPAVLGIYGIWRADNLTEAPMTWVAPFDAVIRVYATVF